MQISLTFFKKFLNISSNARFACNYLIFRNSTELVHFKVATSIYEYIDEKYFEIVQLL